MYNSHSVSLARCYHCIFIGLSDACYFGQHIVPGLEIKFSIYRRSGPSLPNLYQSITRIVMTNKRQQKCTSTRHTSFHEGMQLAVPRLCRSSDSCTGSERTSCQEVRAVPAASNTSHYRLNCSQTATDPFYCHLCTPSTTQDVQLCNVWLFWCLQQVRPWIDDYIRCLYGWQQDLKPNLLAEILPP